MSKKTNKKTDKPEVEQTNQPQADTTQPAYVKQLLEKGVVVIQGRSRGELDEKLAAIPSDVNFYTGHVDHYIGTGLFRVQVNLKEG
jgi:hypothetical protein